MLLLRTADYIHKRGLASRRCRTFPAAFQQLPTLIAIPLGPNAVPPGSENAIGIQAVFHVFVEAEQCMVIPRVSVCHLVS